MVPDVTDTLEAHPLQENLPSAIRQPTADPHNGHTNPSGHRNPTQDLDTRQIIRKPLQKRRPRPRIVHPGLRMIRHLATHSDLLY